jgi:hypothetical protein
MEIIIIVIITFSTHKLSYPFPLILDENNTYVFTTEETISEFYAYITYVQLKIMESNST